MAELVDNLEEAAKYKVSGRVDMSRMYLAKSRWLESESTFEFHVIARDIATWYQDYFRFSDSITDTNDKAKDAINQ